MLEFNPIEEVNAEQAREYNRAQALNNCLNEESKTSALYPPFDAEAKLFFNNNKKLIALVPGKDSNGTTITQNKESLKIRIAESANVICTRTAAYAIKIGDTDLQAAIYHSTSAITRLKDADVLAFVTRLTGIVSPLLAKPDFLPYAVTSEMLEIITENATAFNNSIGKAKYVDSQMSSVSEEIDKVLKAIRDNVVQFDLLLNFFEAEYPGFVKAYRTAAAIDYSNVRHSGVKGVVRSSTTGKAMEKVSITLKGKKKTKTTTTDSDGVYDIAKFYAGKCTLTIGAPGYNTQIIEVTIIRGKTLEQNITLQAQSLSLNATA